MFKRKNPRMFNVYSTNFRVAIAVRGLKVNRLDERNKPVGKPIWGTFEEVTGLSGEDCYYDITPAQISAFIRRTVFGKDAPVPKADYDYYQSYN